MKPDQPFDDQTRLTTEYYDARAKEFAEGTKYLDLGKLNDKFLSLVQPGGHILDAGCGSGRDSKYFLSRGFQVTALDASEQLVALASEFIGQPVVHMSFEEIDYVEQFDGIWAAASLLHVPRIKMDDVFSKLTTALKPNGVFFASFKYGTNEEFRQGRLFNDYTKDTFNEFLKGHQRLSLIESWKHADSRPDRAGEFWLNILLRKV